MAERIDGEVTLIQTEKLWGFGNEFMGIDLIKVNEQNNLRFYILLCDLSLSFSFKQIGISMRIFRLQAATQIGFK